MFLRFNREFVISEPACSTLTHLTIDACFSADIPQLLELCPNLCSLKLKAESSTRRFPFHNLTNIEFHQRHLTSITRSSLFYFHLDINDLNLLDIQFILCLMPNLVRFRLEGLSYDLNLSNGDLWQKFLEKQTKNLKQFELAGVRIWLGNNADDNDDETNVHLINEINESFGKHHPFWGKNWFVYQTHKLRPNHLSLNLSAKKI